MNVCFPLITAIFSVLLVMVLPGCKDDAGSTHSDTAIPEIPAIERPTLSFYHIPRCFLCDQLSEVIEKSEKRYRSQMNFRTVDYHLSTSQATIKRFELGSHGIVITGAQGEKLWTFPAHQEGKEALAAAITRVVHDQASR